jgi:hypothetical protein
MILRRVISHVRNQEWTAIVIDFLIVVAGVFVASQVTNWNAGRATQARAEVFSSRLTEDLRYEAWAYEYQIEYYKDVLASADVAVTTLSGDASKTDEAFLIAAYRATQYFGSTIEQQRATYEELVSTGQIGLIVDDTLRAAAVALYTITTIDIISEKARNSEYRVIFRQRVPVDAQRALLQACGDRIPDPGDYHAIVGSLDYPCTLDLTPERVAAAAAALRSDEAALPALQLRTADIETAVTTLSTSFPVMLANLQRIARRP